MKLDSKYEQEHGAVYLTGIQALVRLPMDQMRRDQRAGLHTAAFISGYEGSPLGGYDLALARVKHLLDQHRIHFVPGVNEDLAATALGVAFFAVRALAALPSSITLVGKYPDWRNCAMTSLEEAASRTPTDSWPRASRAT